MSIRKLIIKIKTIHLSIWILFPLLCMSQEKNFPIDKIVVKRNDKTSAIVRNNDQTITVKNSNNLIFEQKVAITILSPEAKHFSMLEIPYAKDMNVEILTASVFNRTGEEVKILKKKEIVEVKGKLKGTKIKKATLSWDDYPYTVSFHYTISVGYPLLSFPSWIPWQDQNIPVESANYTIITPKDFNIRYIEENLKYPVEISHNSESDIYRWNIGEINVFEPRSYGESFWETAPKVFAAPLVFTTNNKESKTIDSWKNLGDVLYETLKEKGELPAEIKTKILELTVNLTDTFKKVQAIYAYLQATTNYSPLPKEIMGWKPYSPHEVNQEGYAGCMGLVNYAYVMLKSIGIDSYHTLVFSGPHPTNIDKSFAIQRFNHAILTVPIGKDTIWLECTSKITPFGYLDKNLCNRNALLIKENNSEIIRTKKYLAKENETVAISKLSIHPNGMLNLSMHSKSKGLEMEKGDLLQAIRGDHLNQKGWVYENLGLPNFTLDSFKLSLENKAKIPAAKKEVYLKIPLYGTSNNDLIVLKINPYNHPLKVPEKVETRSSDILLKDGFLRIDTILLEIPEGYSIAQFPNNQNFKSSFGSFTSTCSIDKKNRTITYIQQFFINEGAFSPGEYNEMRRFYLNLTKALEAEVILSKT